MPPLPFPDDLVVADVKCYFCGHVSGRVAGRRGTPVREARFMPRKGYRGPEITPGSRLRCERCRGPVFLEDSTPMARAESDLARSLGVKTGQPKKSKTAA